MGNVIIFRIDAGKKYGMGHLSRNLVISQIFKSQNIGCKFFVKSDDKNEVLSYLSSNNFRNYKCRFLSSDISPEEDVSALSTCSNVQNEFLILDHYSHDLKYQEALAKAGFRWAQFDVNRSSPVISDVLINPNIGVRESDYNGLAKKDTVLCVGERYAIIGEHFKNVNEVNQEKGVLISMGGGTYPNIVRELIRLLIESVDYKFNVVTNDFSLINQIKGNENANIFTFPKNIASIYKKNQLAIVAGGVTSYELAYLKVPMIVIPYADNQVRNSKNWHRLKYGIAFESPEIFNSILKLKGFYWIMSRALNHYDRKSTLIDGNGANRIVKAIKSKLNERR